MGGGAVDASQVRINVTDTNAMERVLLDRTNNVTVLNYSTKLTSTSGGAVPWRFELRNKGLTH